VDCDNSVEKDKHELENATTSSVSSASPHSSNTSPHEASSIPASLQSPPALSPTLHREIKSDNKESVDQPRRHCSEVMSSKKHISSSQLKQKEKPTKSAPLFRTTTESKQQESFHKVVKDRDKDKDKDKDRDKDKDKKREKSKTKERRQSRKRNAK
jgi:hypothetical protein